MEQNLQHQVIDTKGQFLLIILQKNLQTKETTIIKLYTHKNEKCVDYCSMLEKEYEFYNKCHGISLVSKAHKFYKDYKFTRNGEQIVGCAMEMEYAPEKDFGKLVYSEDQLFQQSLQKIKMFKSYALQMAKAVQQLHSNNIVHNDIKDDNFFMYSFDLNKEEVNLKIADFGYSGVMVDGEKRKFKEIYETVKDKIAATLSPEQLIIQQKQSLRPIDEKLSDIYCLGMTLFQSFTRISLKIFKNQQFQQLIVDRIDTKNLIRNFSSEIENLLKLNEDSGKISEILIFILQMLHSDPSKRSSLQKFIEQIEKI